MESNDHVVWEKLGAGSGQRSLVESGEHVVCEKLGAGSLEQMIGSRGKLAKCGHRGALKRSRRRFCMTKTES